MDPQQTYPPQSPTPTPPPSAGGYFAGEQPQASMPSQPNSIPQPQPYQQPQHAWTQQSPQSYTQSPQLPRPHDMTQSQPSYTPPPRPKSYGKTPLPIRIVEWFKSRWYIPILLIVVLVVIGNIVWQVLYPINALPPNMHVDGQNLGGMERDKAVAELNKAYGRLKVDLYFGEATVPYKSPTMKELGIEADNTARLASASYPFALRFVPTSYWWAASTVRVEGPTYNYHKPTLDTYAMTHLGEDCVIPETNATLKLDDNQFVVVPAEPGGRCNLTEFKNAVGNVTYADGLSVKTDMREVPAPLTNAIAQQLADDLNNNLRRDMALQAGGETTTVRSATVKSWLSFVATIPEDPEAEDAQPPQLAYVIEPDRVKRYLDTSGISAKVEKKPGVTRISTTNFTETARTNGESGVLIDLDATITSIDPFIAGRADRATVSVGPVPPTMRYTRKYTPTEEGYRALVEQFANDNPGTVAVSLSEHSGKRPHFSVAVNDTVKLPAAGVEGVYVAYAVQKGIEDGVTQPTDSVFGGMTYAECMELAISVQDSDCIGALVRGIGNATAQARLAEIGLADTSLSGEVATTTARDMATFMHKLNTNGLPIKRQGDLVRSLTDLSLRDGMKSVAANARVAGGNQTERNYNETAFVSERGQFVVSIMTEGSQGADTAAKLLRAINEIRQQKQDVR